MKVAGLSFKALHDWLGPMRVTHGNITEFYGQHHEQPYVHRILAEMLDVSTRTIVRWAADDNIPSHNIDAICKVFNEHPAMIWGAEYHDWNPLAVELPLAPLRLLTRSWSAITLSRRLSISLADATDILEHDAIVPEFAHRWCAILDLDPFIVWGEEWVQCSERLEGAS